MSKPGISWKWVILGSSLIIVLNQVLIQIMSGPLSGALEIGDNGIATGVTAMFWVFLALIAIGSYFVGGMLTGYLSPGHTIKEPAAAAALAVTFNSVIDYALKSRSDAFAVGPWLIGALVMVALGFALGLAGGWLGERLQGDNLAKMRERGEMPPAH